MRHLAFLVLPRSPANTVCTVAVRQTYQKSLHQYLKAFIYRYWPPRHLLAQNFLTRWIQTPARNFFYVGLRQSKHDPKFWSSLRSVLQLFQENIRLIRSVHLFTVSILRRTLQFKNESTYFSISTSYSLSWIPTGSFTYPAWVNHHLERPPFWVVHHLGSINISVRHILLII